MAAPKRRLDSLIWFRAPAAATARLDALAERVPFASRSDIAREALTIGMAAIERDPAAVLFARRGGGRVK